MLIPLSMNKTGQTEYMEAVAGEVEIWEVEIFEIFEETPKAMVFEAVDLEADMTHLLHAKRSAMCVRK